MAIKCGNCKGRHDSVGEVARCYSDASPVSSKFVDDGMEKVSNGPQWPPSEAQVKYVLGLQDERNLPKWWTVYTEADLYGMEKDDVSKAINQLTTFTKKPTADRHYDAPNIPAGRYAVHMTDNAAQLRWLFYEVQDGKGRWAGRKFMKRLIGAPGHYQKAQTTKPERDRVLRQIEKVGFKQAMLDYGRHSGVCGRCSSPLTDPESLARGIGPICAGKMGW